ncbi:MAG TPA: class I SAM-dependent methyltransferase [Anaerolineales bacterium]
MNTSQSFDRAARVYDQTRPLPEPIATLGIQAILDITGPQAFILDAGTGTGRISIPLLNRGARLVGCDLSVKMLLRLQEKFALPPVVQADAALLPFPTNSFDALLTVHVMHLVGPWREALREFKRVLRSGGKYLNIRTYEPVGNSVRQQVRDFWRSWVIARGINVRQMGVQNRMEFLQELHRMNASVTEIEAVRYTHTYTLREELERYQTRVSSDSWQIPADIFESSVQELRAHVLDNYGSLDGQIEDEVRFVIDVARFEN